MMTTTIITVIMITTETINDYENQSADTINFGIKCIIMSNNLMLNLKVVTLGLSGFS